MNVRKKSISFAFQVAFSTSAYNNFAAVWPLDRPVLPCVEKLLGKQIMEVRVHMSCAAIYDDYTTNNRWDGDEAAEVMKEDKRKYSCGLSAEEWLCWLQKYVGFSSRLRNSFSWSPQFYVDAWDSEDRTWNL
jgi:hypothetical protein